MIAKLLRRQAGRSREVLLGILLASCIDAAAQAPDPLEPFVGTWSGVFTTQDHAWWTAADLVCFGGCPAGFYEHLSALLADPANDAVPIFALADWSGAMSLAALEAVLTPLGRQVRAANRPENDPKLLNCQPYGFVREVTNPLPMQIRRDGDHLLVRYEEWSLLRPIYMDGRPQPTLRTPSLLGHSVGHIENGVLIVETARMTPDLISDQSQVGHSGELTAIERYSVHDNPRRLELTLTLSDPMTFTQPLIVTKTWLYTSDVELVQDSCTQQPGKP